MAINFDKALGIHPQALLLRAKRAELLANNLTNADTPGYKAQDFDFKAALQQSERGLAASANPTQPGHLGKPDALANNLNLQYRIPLQPSLDGNTVDSQLEVAAYSENAMQYEVSLHFVSGRFRSLLTALRGD